MEIWKNIKGYEGKYQISNIGRVKSLIGNRNNNREKILKLRKNEHGYLYVRLYKKSNGKYCLVHRLVAETFLENQNKYPIINHKDEDKTNNRVENLEWCSYKYNNNYGNRIENMVSKRNKKVKCITNGEEFNSIKEAAEFAGIKNGSDITKCCRGKRNTAGKHPVTGKKLKWKYL